MMTKTELARFVDRYTMEHVRFYPHPVERVWRAITESEHSATWFTEVDFELKVGGVARFGPADTPWWTSMVTAIDPPRLIEFGDPKPSSGEGFMRYELFEVEGGCRMVFTQHFEPRAHFDASPEDPLGGDLPGGPDTPWKPGFVGGWHDFFDRLGRSLDGVPVTEGRDDSVVIQVAEHAIERLRNEHGLSNEMAERFRIALLEADVWNELNRIYREHIRDNIPPAS